MSVEDPLAIERAIALRLRQKSRSQRWKIIICLVIAALAAGLYVYQDAKTTPARPQPVVMTPPVRPVSPAPAPVIDKDQTKINTPSATEGEPARLTAPAPTTATRQIEVGQRPVPPPAPAAGTDEEPITMTTAPLPIPRIP